MTYTKPVTTTNYLRLYLADSNDPSKGYRVALGASEGILSLEDAKELAEYIWVRIPDND